MMAGDDIGDHEREAEAKGEALRLQRREAMFLVDPPASMIDISKPVHRVRGGGLRCMREGHRLCGLIAKQFRKATAQG